MKRRASKAVVRRRIPVQERAQVTVEAMMDAVVKLLKRGGASTVSTNRIAEVAGVSIGSVYQYFPNKRAIFIALHERHIRQVEDVMRRVLAAHEESSLEELVKALIDAIVDVHAVDPELAELLQSEVPHRADGTRDFSVRLHDGFKSALSRCGVRKADLDTRAFFMGNMVDALGHAVALTRPRGLSLGRAKAEACRAIVAYLG